jgi:hypothetical protein
MIPLTIYLNQLRFKVFTDLVEQLPHRCVVLCAKHFFTVFGDKHQMDVDVKNTVPTGSDLD